MYTHICIHIYIDVLDTLKIHIPGSPPQTSEKGARQLHFFFFFLFFEGGDKALSPSLHGAALPPEQQRALLGAARRPCSTQGQEREVPSSQDPGSLNFLSSLQHCHFACPRKLERRPTPLPAQVAFEDSTVSRARQAVRFQMRSIPGVSQARRPPCSPLTWHSKPSRPWWFSAPSPGAVRPRCPCRPGPHSVELPWRQRKRSAARCRVSASRNSLPLQPSAPRVGTQTLAPAHCVAQSRSIGSVTVVQFPEFTLLLE